MDIAALGAETIPNLGKPGLLELAAKLNGRSKACAMPGRRKGGDRGEVDVYTHVFDTECVFPRRLRCRNPWQTRMRLAG